MYRKSALTNLVSAALATTFLLETLPMLSNTMSLMPSMQMDHQAVMEMGSYKPNIITGNMHEATSQPCCELICPFSILLMPLDMYAIPYMNNEQVVSSNPIIQPVYIELTVPPPKA